MTEERKVHTLAAGVSYIDLEFLGRRRAIASAILTGAGEVAIVDCGPSTTLSTLRARLADLGLTIADITHLLITHIHLDHSGAAGGLLEENSRIRVLVHERGAPHMVDPSKLVSSAARLYEGQMDSLWGAILPVPASALTVLTGGERITVAGRGLDVAYTPGHASHHVRYLDRDTGIAFVGDTAGLRVTVSGPPLPPTPPPDIDLELWSASLATIERWRPDTLFLTHFGPSSPVTVHLSDLRDHLEQAARWAKESLALEGDDREKEAWFIERMRRDLRARVSEPDASTYEMAGRFDLSWRGLARYLRKRA
ncbi:MAG: MBL fold metallo-hydrolase [Acidobacteriaceae bacterium]|jgi:glyoxylase-like metal-dependent hydrolase (beta-lactamase superfamily II)|nr:MBL fold metallo-hydrolase [Acidobacteriaceae bacterium]